MYLKIGLKCITFVNELSCFLIFKPYGLLLLRYGYM